MTAPRHRTGMDPAHQEPRRLTVDEQLDGLGLFATPAPEKPRWQTAGEDDEARMIELLVPIARELAEKAGPYNPITRLGGIIMADVRHTAVARGLITGAENGRRLSYLGRVAQAAGLIGTGDFRRSSVARSHGNAHVVWTLPGGCT